MIAASCRSFFWASLVFSSTIAVAAAPPRSVARVQASAEQHLVLVQYGDIPLVLSAPHGGREAIPGVSPRTGDGVKKFVAQRDENTAELVQTIAGLIEQRHRVRPYVVIARFERKYCDVNRPEDSAIESPTAKPYYQAYHGVLAEYCRDVQRRWHGGLLLDIHGQAGYKDDVIRGTNNTQTVKLLIERQGMGAVNGPKSLFGFLQAAGYGVLPKLETADREVPQYNGGYTVSTYGSDNPGGIDAIQMEFGSNLRIPRSVIDKTAPATAAAIEGFSASFWPQLLKPAKAGPPRSTQRVPAP